MKILISAAFIIFLAGFGSSTYSQRCGDGIWLHFGKSGDGSIDSAHLKVKLKTFDRRFKYYNAPGHTEPLIDTLSDTAAYVTFVNEVSAEISLGDSNRIYFPTLCGFFRMEFTFTDPLNDTSMKIYILRVPHDILLKLNNIVLANGEFVYDINWMPDSKVFKEDKEGIYNFDISDFSSRQK